MSPSETEKMNHILHEIEGWSQASRLALVQKVLGSFTVDPSDGTVLRTPVGPVKSLGDLRGLLVTSGTALSDADYANILEEERLRKYGVLKQIRG